MKTEKIKACLVYALARETSVPAIRIALVVGSLLVLINQWDAVTGKASLEWGKLVLTYMVPYGVSTYTSVRRDLMAARPTQTE